MQKFLVFILAFIAATFALTSVSQPASAGANTQESDLLAHGKYIASIAGCTSCHTPDRAEFQNPQTLTLEQIQTIAFRGNEALDNEKFLAGGRAFDLGPAGVVFTRNLTPDDETGLGTWTDEQVKLAIKTGVDKDGKTLFPVMPYHVYNGMADSDLEAVLAFVRSVDAVSNDVPERTVSTEGMPTPPYTENIPLPDPSDLAARGAYLVNNVTGCTDCHTPIDPNTGAPVLEKYLAGRQPYEGPWGVVYGGNITPDVETGIGDWTEEEIKRAIVSGIGKDGRRLILMPWFAYSSLSGDDADAIVYYLKNVLPAVKNEIPSPSLNPGFEVMATDAQQSQESNTSWLTSPYVLGAVGFIVALAGFVFFRKRLKTL